MSLLGLKSISAQSEVFNCKVSRIETTSMHQEIHQLRSMTKHKLTHNFRRLCKSLQTNASRYVSTNINLHTPRTSNNDSSCYHASALFRMTSRCKTTWRQSTHKLVKFSRVSFRFCAFYVG